MDIDSSSKPGLSAMMPLAAGLLGVLIGVIALFMSLSNSSALTAIKTSVTEMQATTDSLKTVQSDVQSIKQKVDANAGALDTVRSGLQSTLNAFGADVASRIAAINDKVDHLGRPAVAASTGRSGGGETTVTSAGGTHKVVSGDTLIALARKYGITLAALQAANPGVTATNLQVNQMLTIPASSSSTSAPAPRAGSASARSTS